jgi:hypothetical protein
MILFGDVSPAVAASLVALGIAAVVSPAAGWFLQSRQFREERRSRAEERAYDRESRAEERAHDRERWQQEKDAQRDLAQIGRRREVMDEFRAHIIVVLLTTNRWQRSNRYGHLVAADHDGAGERQTASAAIIEAIEGASSTISRVSFAYGDRSAAALAAVRTLQAAVAARDALHGVFIQVANIEQPQQVSDRLTDEQRASARDEQQAALTALDAALDETVTALSAAITALVGAALGDSADRNDETASADDSGADDDVPS